MCIFATKSIAFGDRKRRFVFKMMRSRSRPTEELCLMYFCLYMNDVPHVFGEVSVLIISLWSCMVTTYDII